MNEIPEIVILYGTETGTAKYASEELSILLKSNKYIISLKNLKTFNPIELPNINFVIFVISTHGYGNPPSSCFSFFNFIMRSDLPSILSDVNFTIFGLGDSSYEKFNYCAKVLCARLKMLGANLFHPIGLGDDNHDFGFEGAFEPWTKELIDNLNKNYFPFHSYIGEILYQYDISIELDKDENTLFVNNSSHGPQRGKIIKVEQLTKSLPGIRQVVKVDIETNDEITYSPGDIALIYPINSIKDDIDYLLSYFSLKSDQNIIIKNKENIIASTTCFDLFEKCIDFNSIVKRRFCRIAKHYCDNEMQKEKLNLYSLSEGKGEFYYYAVKEKRTYIEFLKDFSGIKIPLEVFINEVGFILPREFSISSSYFHENNKHKFEVTVGIIDYYTEFRRRKFGLFSQQLLNLLNNKNFKKNNVTFTIKKGMINDVDVNENMLLIATGTGIAPLRSLLIEKNEKIKKIGTNAQKGKIILIYGCRDKDADYLYKNEFENKNTFYNNLDLTIYPAFSRSNGTNNKYYVQNIIIDYSKKIIPFILDDNCKSIILVGNSKFLPKAIQMSIIKGICNEKGFTNEEEGIKLYDQTIKNKMHVESW